MSPHPIEQERRHARDGVEAARRPDDPGGDDVAIEGDRVDAQQRQDHG